VSSQFVTVAREDSLAEGSALSVAVGDRLIAIFRHQGKLYAINDSCLHMGASLAEGHVQDGIVTCPWHAWRFCIRDGTWCDNPRIKVESYSVRVVDGDIQVGVDE
jgi:nitrite reductase (NADH) small subunit/3-phenylpropionate/trans-cinnamate dioxygenase ferredoxin subunit